MNLLLEENPMYEFYANPRRRHHKKSRNPVASLTSGVKSWTQGVDMMDIAAGTAGFAAAAMLPGIFIKDTSTTMQKWLKIGAAAASAVVVGMLVKRFMSPSAGKAAVIGGLAGTASQAINLLRPGTIGARTGLLPAGRPVGRVGASTIVSPSFNREGETVQLIIP